MEGQFLDFGVVLFQTGDGSGTFKDGGGNTQNAGQLSAAGFVDGAVFQAGRAFSLASAVHLARGGGHLTNIRVQLLQRREDRNNAGLFSWAPVMTTRSDTGVSAFAHAIAAADALDLFFTCDPKATGSYKWQVKADNDGTGPGATDKVVIGVTAV